MSIKRIKAWRKRRPDRIFLPRPLFVAYLQSVYLGAVDAAPITDNAQSLAYVIELNLDSIATMMRIDDEHSFFDEVYAIKGFSKGYIRQLVEELTSAGLLEPATIAGKEAWLPRIPQEAWLPRDPDEGRP